MYAGKINADGNCNVVIPPLREITDAKGGKAKLEVIAESTLFEPWKSDFSVKQLKQVTVETKEPTINVITEINELVGDQPFATTLEFKKHLKENLQTLKRNVNKLSNKVTSEVYGISAMTGAKSKYIQQFIDTNKLNERKLFNLLWKSDTAKRMQFTNAIIEEFDKNLNK